MGKLLPNNMEGIRLDEETTLKVVGCKSLVGSSPTPSAFYGRARSSTYIAC